MPARPPRGTRPAPSRTHPFSLRDGGRPAGTAAGRAHRFAPAGVRGTVIAIERSRDNRDMIPTGCRCPRDNRDMAIEPPLEARPLPAPRPCAG
ncbi:hypothetical protein GCM10027184_74060 [Saccharothrix stipae]